MRGNAIRRPDARESVASARARMAALLASCTDAALDRMTPANLAATHRVKVDEAEAALFDARERRRQHG
jgi:hypothetical protein